MPSELVALVEREPGRAKWHYLGMSPEKGGVRGLLQHKIEAFRGLVRERKLVRGAHYAGRRGTKGWYSAGHRGCNLTGPELELKPGEAGLRKGLLALVQHEPGRGQSHYCRLPPAQGGLPGSQERKERALSALLAEGVLQLRDLPRPIGRQRNGVYPAAEAV